MSRPVLEVVNGSALGANDRRAAACARCPIGKAAGVGQGGRCPMSDRPRAAGTFLYSEGETVDKVWFVKQGTVVLSREADDRRGRGVAWAIRRAGTLLGVEGLVRRTYLDSARAVTDVTLCSASREEIEAWVDAREPAARALLDLVLRAQAHDFPRRARSEGNAVKRVARWLLDEGPESAAGIPRTVLAELLGMLPETLSRALAALVARGALETTRRSIRIAGVEALNEAAGVSPDEATGSSPRWTSRSPPIRRSCS